MKGALAEGVLPSVLRELYVGRKTGALHCLNGDERRSVRLQRGTIINGDTNVIEERLGEVLVRRGVISPAEFAQATDIMAAKKKRLGQALVELGLLDDDGLERAIALHVREILTKVFTWNEGTYEFEERPDGPVDEELTLKLSTGELILQAVRAIQDPDVVRYALGDIDRILALSSDPLLRFQKLTLSPSDGFVLSRVDGTTSARALVQIVALPAEETQKSLFGLLSTGIVEYLPGARAPRPTPTPPPPVSATPMAAPLPPPAPMAASAVIRPAPVVTPPQRVPVPPTSEPPFTDFGTRKAAEARRQEILETYGNIKTKNHFDILGIPRASSEAQVKEAYFRLAKRFHPDVHHDPSLSDLRDRLEAVFIRLGEAYEILRNPRTRASYEARLGASAPPPSSGPAPATFAPTSAPDPGAEARTAEIQLMHGEKYLEAEKYWDAIQALEPAVKVLTGKLRQRARVGLARAYLKNPKWVKRAEETLLAVIHDDPQNLDGHLLLGRIYKQQGLKTRSHAMLRKVLEIKPDHEEAAAELAEPAVEPEPPSGSSGLMRKLFGKKG